MMQLFSRLETTELARIVGESLAITAWLSAIHVIGFTLVMSAGIVWNLHAAGLLLRSAPAKAVAGSAVRLLALGLAVSLLTGFALFLPRASQAAALGVFRLKMALLLSAAAYQFTVNALVLRKPNVSLNSLRASGILGTMLWAALAMTACWFILFE